MLVPALFVTLSILPAAGPPATVQVLETTETQRVVATLTYAVRCDQFRAREWVVFVAQAPELPGQGKVESRLDLGESTVRDLSPLKRPLLMARVPVRSKEQESSIALRVTYEATLLSRKLKPLAAGAVVPRVEPIADRAREAALAALGEIDYKSEVFQAWLAERKLRRARGETDLAFARRVFLDIRAAYRYEYRERMDRHASAVCKAGSTDCGGLAALFVAALRANGVPSRALYGRWALSAVADATLGGLPYYQTHVKAEFYAADVGWVPVDLASGILHDRSRDGLAYFGNDRGDFLTLHIDPSLELDTRFLGRKTVSCLQVPAYWAAGPGSVDSRTIKEGWEVKKLP